MDEPNLIPTPLPGIPQASTRYAKVCFFEGFAELCGHMGDAEFADRTALDCSCYKIGFLGEELLC